MCGIATIFHYKSGTVEKAQLLRMRDAMKTRGPDGSGVWVSADCRLGLAHRRLSVIDLSENAGQPMLSVDGRYIISFNGEIYNYREIRERLIRKGHRFKSESDTEVLLELYREKGKDLLYEIRGMFAFTIWDNNEKVLFLARDPYGIKPLYYSDDGHVIRIASQVKALLAGGAIPRSVDAAGVVGFFLMGSVPEPYTINKNIKALPSGHCMYVNYAGVQEPKEYLSITRVFAQAAASPESGVAIKSTLLDTVKHHFVSDVPVGIFLSGGVDSGALVGLARDAGLKTTAITLAFDEFRDSQEDEVPLAKETAAHYGIEHFIYRLTQEEFQKDLPKIWDAMDQPSIDGINTYFVSKAARNYGLKVVLSGLGGDELFAGYPTFKSIPRMVRRLRRFSRMPFLGDAYRMYHSKFSKHRFQREPQFPGRVKYGGSYAGAYLLCRGLFMPWELGALLDEEVLREGFNRLDILRHIDNAIKPDPQNDYARVACLEASFYMRNQLLQSVDWAGMAHGVEIRVPYIDINLLRAVAGVQASAKELDFSPISPDKELLVKSLSRPLPAGVTNRAKTGFCLPLDLWLEAKGYDSWKGVALLSRSWGHWFRRWAYVVFQQFGADSCLKKNSIQLFN
ncbi:MAG: asparagine synthase (glutamine-hydrolyzing) [Candidatus Omnitrophota bacterium]